MGEPAKYFAYLSYSHADEAWAMWLHRALERYRVPARLVGRATPMGVVPRALFPVFRDREDLASAHELSGEIERALDASRCLIVICSPNAVASRWVNEEVLHFKRGRRGDRILCLIVDGEPGDPERECFPEAVRCRVDADGNLTAEPAEPLAADLRKGADGKSDARLKLIAGVLGVGFDELKRRELAARNRRLTALSTAAVALSGAMIYLTVVATTARDEARAQRGVAEQRRSQAEGLIQFMLGDLRGKLEPLGKLDVLDAVGEQAMDYFAQVDAGELSDEELSARATALRQIGDVRVQQGELDKAAVVFRQALKLDEEIVRRHPDDQQALYNLAQSDFYIGYDRYLRADYAAARQWWESYRNHADRLVELDGDNADWAVEAASARINLGALSKATGEQEAALAELEAARAILEPLVERQPGDERFVGPYATALSWIGGLQLELGRRDSALQTYDAQLRLDERRLAQDPQNWTVLALYVRHGLTYAADLVNADVAGRALELLARLEAPLARMCEHDPDNQEWQLAQLDFARLTARAELKAGDIAAGLNGLNAALATVQRRAADEAGIAWRKRGSGIAARLAEYQQGTGDEAAARAAIAAGFALWERAGRSELPEHESTQFLCAAARRVGTPQASHPRCNAAADFTAAANSKQPLERQP